MPAYENGYDDYTLFGYDCPCPYEPESKEEKLWYQGFNAAVEDQLSSDWDMADEDRSL